MSNTDLERLWSFPWISIQCLWEFYGMPIDVYGLSMECLWDLHGIVYNFYGLDMEVLFAFYVISHRLSTTCLYHVIMTQKTQSNLYIRL